MVSWNVELGSGGQSLAKLALVERFEPDLVLLQEVMQGGCSVLEALDRYASVFHSATLRPRLADETTSRARYCAILTSERFEVRRGPEVLANAPAPERTLTVGLKLDGKTDVEAASFHFVAGSDPKWGRLAKGINFRVVTDWMAAVPATGIVGIDANSPKLDHPEVSRNVYFGGEIQREYVLHDPLRATHRLRDALRTWLDANPKELSEIRRLRPEGPLAVSHINRGNSRRFDFLFVGTAYEPTSVTYEYEAARQVGANHAPVVVNLAVAG